MESVISLTRVMHNCSIDFIFRIEQGGTKIVTSKHYPAVDYKCNVITAEDI